MAFYERISSNNFFFLNQGLVYQLAYQNVTLRWNLKTPLLLSTRIVSRELCHGFSTAVEPGNRRISKHNGGYVLIFMPMFVMTLSAVFAKRKSNHNEPVQNFLWGWVN